MAVGAVSRAARKGFDLQGWLEERAQGPVYAMASASMILRAALFYSGQGAQFEQMVGPFGMGLINALTAIGLAAGGELLASIAGRSWKRNIAESAEASMRTDLKPMQRDVMATLFLKKARTDRLFMLVGVGASFIAAMSYMWIANPDHSVGAFISEFVLTALLLSIMTYLGIFKEGKRRNVAEEQTERAEDVHSRIVDAAGARIAAGTHTVQDVRIFARALPRLARDKFLAAFAADTPDDPTWTTTDIANWLNCNHQAGKRQITRKLARLAETGAPITRDERGAYRMPRSAVFLHFAEDFQGMLHSGQNTPTMRTVRRPSGPVNAQPMASDTDSDPSASSAGQPISPVGEHVASVA